MDNSNAKSALLALERMLAPVDEDLSEAVTTTLGARPVDLDPYIDQTKWDDTLAQICIANRWHEDLPGLTYFYKALHKIVGERGSTSEAAQSVRSDLQGGDIKAMLVFHDREKIEIQPYNWLSSAEHSKELWWYGKGIVKVDGEDSQRGVVYVVNDNLENKTVLPDQKKKEELRERERDTYRKLILGLSLIAYNFSPSDRRNIAKEISEDLLKYNLSVGEETIRNKLKDAIDMHYTEI